MLARAPPPSIPFPARNKVCNRREIVRLFRNGVGGGGVVARDGFTRRPLKTSSAYEVVNDSTDEGFIVIRGGDQEKEFYPPPPSDLLSSSPSESERRSGSRSRGVTSSFGRLKAQKVKALVGKVTLKKKQQQRMSHNEEEDEDEDEDEDYSADEGFGSSSILDLMRKKLAMKDVPRSGKSVETKEVKRFSKVSESREPRDLDRLGRDNDEDSEEDSYPRKFTDNERSGSRSSYSKGYGANSRDRGDRLSVAKDSDTYKRQDRVVDEVSNPRKFIDNEREGMRSSRGREDRRVVAKDSDTYQGRDRAIDQVSNARRFTGNERSGSNFSYSKDAESRGWGDRRSVVYGRDMEDWRERRKTNNSRETGFFSRKAFAEIGCSELMMKALKENNFDRPAHIQALAFAPIVDGKSCIIADQSGSGKTLAYLVPVIQRIREEELQGKSESSPGCPRVIVLVPTAELASQVLANCRLISKSGVPFRSMVMTGGFKQRTQLENLKQSVDVVIATPGRFMYLMKEGILGLSNLRCAILDEVDILFGDEEFETALQSLISSSPVTAQYLFVTATLPLEIYNKLVEVFPDCEVVMGPRVHRVSNALEEILVDCSGDDNAEKSPETAFLNKKNALLQIVEQTPVAKTIIFCNKIETCRKVENIFKRFDRKERQLHVLPFHAALEQESRLRNMEEFTSVHPEENSLFLVCTDRASRGIDFSGVDHVVLFDFPRDPSEYVRRVGRTARGARGEGKAFVFVVGKQVALARRILERNQKGYPVHDVPNAYEFTT